MIRTDIINHLIEKVGYKKSYLEIGVSNPRWNYYKVACAHKECIDPLKEDSRVPIEERQYLIDNVLTYHMTSDKFFEMYNNKYDIIFIDGLHYAEQVRRDIINSYNHLNEGGYILLHDCLPVKEQFQEENIELLYTLPTWNGSTWKAIPNLYKANLNYYTIDTDEGCCLIKYDGPKDFSNYEITNLSYSDVFSNINIRNNIMHVISEQEFLNI